MSQNYRAADASTLRLMAGADCIALKCSIGDSADPIYSYNSPLIGQSTRRRVLSITQKIRYVALSRSQFTDCCASGRAVHSIDIRLIQRGRYYDDSSKATISPNEIVIGLRLAMVANCTVSAPIMIGDAAR